MLLDSVKAYGQPNADLAPPTGSRKIDFVTSLKEVAWEVLNRPLLRPFLKLLAYVRFFCAHRYFPVIDCKDGLWIHRHPDGVIVNTRPTLQTPADLVDRLPQLYLQKYSPKRGDIIVDVGAGIGQEILPLARMVGPTGRVIAIEAHPETFRCLEVMCEANKLSNVTLSRTAVLEREGYIEISTTDKHQGATVVGVHKNKPVRIPGNTLDRTLADFGVSKVDFLKMNIEGAERFAILGMDKTIRNTEHLCICCHDFKSHEENEPEMRTKALVLDFLHSHGFDTQMIPDDPAPWVRDHVYARRVVGTPLIQTLEITK